MKPNARNRIERIERALLSPPCRTFFVDGDAPDRDERAAAIRKERGENCEIVFIGWMQPAQPESVSLH